MRAEAVDQWASSRAAWCNEARMRSNASPLLMTAPTPVDARSARIPLSRAAILHTDMAGAAPNRVTPCRGATSVAPEAQR